MVTSNNTDKEKVSKYPLKNIPEDVYKILYREQARLKTKKGQRQFSLGSTIYYIVREFDRMLKDKNCPE